MKKLKKEQMEKVVGGVSAKEYCATLKMIILNNPGLDVGGASYGIAVCKENGIDIT